MQDDDLYLKARMIVFSTGNFSISHLQRKLQINYNNARTLMEEIEDSKPKLIPRKIIKFRKKHHK